MYAYTKYIYLFVFFYFSLSPFYLFLLSLSINAMIEIKLMQADEMKNVLYAKSVS